MSKYAILRAEKLKTMGNIGGSLSHNYRDRATPNADPARAHLNQHSVATSKEVLDRLQARLPEKRRKDAVLAIEYFIGSSQDAFDDAAGYHRYFDDALAWLEERHGAENVIASSRHFDETTPHLVAYVVPLDESGKLNARKFLGGRETLSSMQTDFAKKVGAQHDLERGIERSTARHTSIKEWYGALNKSVEPIQIPVKHVAPRVLEKRTLLPDIVETPEQVAARLNRALKIFTDPLVSKANTADIERRRVSEIRDLVTYTQRQLENAKERVKAAESEATNLRAIYSALTPSEQKNMVQQAKRNNRIRDRCQQIMTGLYEQATAPVRRFVRKARAALEAASGQWWDVPWRDIERDYVAAETPQTSEVEATKVILDHSPSMANISKQDREAAIAKAEKNDQDRLTTREVKNPVQAPPVETQSPWYRARPKG